MDAQPKRKLRGLFVIEADHSFAVGHPWWDTCKKMQELFEEIHVVVLRSDWVPEEEELLHPDQQLFIYQFSKRFLWFLFPDLLVFLRKHLWWKKLFRPDFVMSFDPGLSARIAWLIAWRGRRDLFVHASMQATERAGLLSRGFVLRRATGIFVPAEQTGQHLSKKLHIPTIRCITLPLPIDIKTLQHMTERYDFTKDHPEYIFFISAGVSTIATMRRLVTIHHKLKKVYPRFALIVVADTNIYNHARRIARFNSRSIFVYPKNDIFGNYLRGTSMYLALSHEQDIDMMMLTAAGLNVPVIAGDYGIAKDIYPGSQYEQFLCKVHDTHAIVAAVLALAKDQYMRDQYGLNNPVLSGKVSFVNTSEYSERLYQLVDTILRPPTVHSAVLPGKHFVFTDI